MADTPVEFTNAQLKLIAEILFGAAYIDGRFVGREAMTIKQILVEQHGGEPLPAPVIEHMSTLPSDGFELRAACEALGISGADDGAKRQALFVLVARVTESDDVLDPAESTFLGDVARFTKAGKHELSDLRGRGGWITSSGD